MKNEQRSLIVWAMICISVISNPLSALTPEENTRYEEAKQLYNGQEFSKAYPILSDLYLNALDNPELNFYLGMCAYETGDYSMAIAAFERVSILDPGNIRNRLELAKTLYQVNVLEESKLHFEEVLNTPALPENIQKNIQFYLSSIAKKQQKSYLTANLRGGVFFDSNVNFGSSNDTFTLPFLGTFPTTEPISDWGHEESLNLSRLDDIGMNGGAVIRNNLNFYQRKYIHEHDYDMFLFSYSPSLLWSDQRSLYELIGGIDLFYLDGTSYSKTYSINPKWTYVLSPLMRQSLSFKTGKREYADIHDLDNKFGELNLGYEYYLSASSALKADIYALRQVHTKGNRIDVDYDEYALSLLYTNQIVPTTIVQLQTHLKKRDYDDFSTLFNDYRTDKIYYGAFNFIQRITPSISAEFNAGYTHTDSTLSIYEYDKYTLSLSLSGRF